MFWARGLYDAGREVMISDKLERAVGRIRMISGAEICNVLIDRMPSQV